MFARRAPGVSIVRYAREGVEGMSVGMQRERERAKQAQQSVVRAKTEKVGCPFFERGQFFVPGGGTASYEVGVRPALH